MRIAAAQTPDFRDDVPAALADVALAAADAGAALLCLPEAYLQGYVTDPDDARRVAIALDSAAFRAVLERLPTAGPTVVLGLIEVEGGRLYNAAAVIVGGRLVGRYRKGHLLRGEACFEPGREMPIFEAEGQRFGINVCNDLNFPEAARRAADQGARLLVCPANNMLARPAAEAWRDRHNAVRGERCRETGLWLISADVTGERDGRMACGPTAVIDPTGEVVAQLPLGTPGLLVYDLPR